MNHRKVQSQLSAYLEGDLAARPRAELESHLAACAECRRELDGLERTVSLLGRLPEPALPADFTRTVMARVREEAARPSLIERLGRGLGGWLFQPWSAPVAALAAGLAAVLLLGDERFVPDSSSSGVPVVAVVPPPAPAAPARRLLDPGAKADGTALAEAQTPRPPLPRSFGAAAAPQVQTVDQRPEQARPDWRSCQRAPNPSAQRSCEIWTEYLMALAHRDAPALVQEVERMPEFDRDLWVHHLASTAARRGRAPDLASRLRGVPSPEAEGLAVRFEQAAFRR